MPKVKTAYIVRELLNKDMACECNRQRKDLIPLGNLREILSVPFVESKVFMFFLFFSFSFQIIDPTATTAIVAKCIHEKTMECARERYPDFFDVEDVVTDSVTLIHDDPLILCVQVKETEDSEAEYFVVQKGREGTFSCPCAGGRKRFNCGHVKSAQDWAEENLVEFEEKKRSVDLSRAFYFFGYGDGVQYLLLHRFYQDARLCKRSH